MKQRPENCQIPSFMYAMIAMDERSGGDVCKGCCYTENECPHSRKMLVGGRIFDIVDSKNLPRGTVWCKNCAKNSSAPISKTLYNGKPGYILKCPYCGGSYVVYKQWYDSKVGFVNHRGEYIPPNSNPITNPTRLQKLRRESGSLSSLFDAVMIDKHGEEEYKKMQQEWAEERQERRAKFEQERKERQEEFKEEQALKKASDFGSRVKAGEIVYRKKQGCWVEVETGKIIKPF